MNKSKFLELVFSVLILITILATINFISENDAQIMRGLLGAILALVILNQLMIGSTRESVKKLIKKEEEHKE